MKKITMVFMGFVFALNVQVAVAAKDVNVGFLPAIYALLLSDDPTPPAYDDTLVYSYSAECTVDTTTVTVSGPPDTLRVTPQQFQLIVDAVAPEGTGGFPVLGSTRVALIDVVEETQVFEFSSVVGSGQRSLGIIVDVPDGTVFIDEVCVIPPEINPDLEYLWSIPSCGPYNTNDAVKVLVEDILGPMYYQERGEFDSTFFDVWKDLVFNPDGTFNSGTFLYAGELLPLPIGGNVVYEFPGVPGGGVLSVRFPYMEKTFLNLCEAPAATPNDNVSYEFTGTCETSEISSAVRVSVSDTSPTHGGHLFNEVRSTPIRWELKKNPITSSGIGGDMIRDGTMLLEAGAPSWEFLIISRSDFEPGDEFVLRQIYTQEDQTEVSEGFVLCTLPPPPGL